MLLGRMGLIVASIVLLYSISGCSVTRKLENNLLFHPTGHLDDFARDPQLEIEDAEFQADDGTRLHGWFFDHPKPRAVVLYAHGNAGNLSDRFSIIQKLREDHELAVMIFDYRSYGKSEGEPTQEGILQDARAARKWLAIRMGIAEAEIVLMGRSLGGAVAVDLASEDGARGLILNSTFTSLAEVASVHFPWLPTKLLVTNRLNSLAKIRKYSGQLLVSHGNADEVIPFEHGRRLFEAARGRKRFVTIQDGTHNSQLTEEFHKALDAFLADLPPLSKPFPATNQTR